VILLGALLAAIGIADTTRPGDSRPPKQQAARSWFLAAATVVTIAWGLALPPWLALLGMVTVGAWIIATATRRSGQWAIGGLAALIVVLVFFVSPDVVPADGPFRVWFDVAAPGPLTIVTFEQLAVAVGGFAFVLNTANIVVRIVVDRTDVEQLPDGELGPVPEPLKGGRFLGPIERILILALGIAGQFPAIGAVVGAKSIIRFPEISQSRDRSSAAEYFLIGSGLSWGIALLMLVFAKIA
jgi:hypothetical protein